MDNRTAKKELYGEYDEIVKDYFTSAEIGTIVNRYRDGEHTDYDLVVLWRAMCKIASGKMSVSRLNKIAMNKDDLEQNLFIVMMEILDKDVPTKLFVSAVIFKMRELKKNKERSLTDVQVDNSTDEELYDGVDDSTAVSMSRGELKNYMTNTYGRDAYNDFMIVFEHTVNDASDKLGVSPRTVDRKKAKMIEMYKKDEHMIEMLKSINKDEVSFAQQNQ